MIRVDICSSDDFDSIARLQTALIAVGIVADDTWHDTLIGTGLTRFSKDGEELTVYRDAWMVDLVGPESLVNLVLQAFEELD